MRRALSRYVILGVTTNLRLLRRIVASDEFEQGSSTRRFCPVFRPTCRRSCPRSAIAAAAWAARSRSNRQPTAATGIPDPRNEASGEEAVARHTTGYRTGDTVVFLEEPEGAEIETSDGAIVAVGIGGARLPVRAIAADGTIHVWCDGETWFSVTRPPAARGSRPADEGAWRAPMPGRIVRTGCVRGSGQARRDLLILGAMKMEHEIKAPRDGVVSRLPFAAGSRSMPERCWIDFT